MPRTTPWVMAALALLLWPQSAAAAKDKAPGFLEQSLDLPGMPAAVIPADMNGDGIDDLVVLVAYTIWGEVAETEQVQFDDIEGLVEVMNVVSSLVNRRELRVYPGKPDVGGFEPHLPPLELDTSVHALGAGNAAEPLLAITDEGIAAVRLDASGQLSLVPLLTAPSSLAGTGSFFSEFDFLEDLDGDGLLDVLLPTESGWSIYGGKTGGFLPSPVAELTVPPRPAHYWNREEGDDEGEGDQHREDDADTDSEEEDPYELEQRQIKIGPKEQPKRPPRPRQPEIRDVNNDGRLDLVVFKADRGRNPLVYLHRDHLGFDPAVEVELPGELEHEVIVYIGDLDGDGLASVVAAQELEPGDEAGFKIQIEHAKEPDFIYRVYPLATDLTVTPEPTQTFEAEGYTFEGEDEGEEAEEDDIEVKLPGGFQDLDGDGRQDLVAITLDFSLVPLIFRALVLGNISLRMDFHPYCQGAGGALGQVPDLDLSGKFKVNLRNVQVKHLSQFEGDFNGDGRADFIQLGRGKKVTIHQGGPGCSYPVEPDRQIRLEKEPKHLGLTRILDLDANGRSDLYVVHPMKDPKSGESIPVRVDLYLSEE